MMKIQVLAKTLGILAGLTTSFILYKAGKIYLIRRKYRHIPGPKTNGIIGYFFGNTSEILRLKKEGKIFVDFLAECHEKYGDVFKYQFMGSVSVFTANKDAIKEILITKNYRKPIELIKFFTYLLGERFVGIGLSTDPDYERQRKRRTFFNRGFHRDVLMTFVNQFNSKADILMEKLRKFADGKTQVELLKEFNKATLDAIAQIAFGLNIDTINQDDTELGKAICLTFQTLSEVVADPLLKIRPSKKQQLKDTIKAIRLIRNMGKDIINNRLNSIKNQEHVQTDILGGILTSWDDELDLEALIDDFVTFFIAGQETTANTLAFSFLELGKNPEAFKKAREEVDRVLGNRPFITYQDAIDLKYCSSIFKETLRLYPPSPLQLRVNTDEMNISGYHIPVNSLVSVSPYVSGRNEKFFKNSLEFKPERFLKDKDSLESSVENYTYFPFSLGPRNCIGQNFAQIEGILLIAKFIQKFDFKLDPTQSFCILDSGTLKPKDGTKGTISLRDN